MWIAAITQLGNNLYYHVQTEVICFIISMVLFVLVYQTKQRQSSHYLCLASGIFCAMGVMFMDILVSVLARYVTVRHTWTVTLAMILNLILYGICLANAYFYMASFIPDTRLTIRHLDMNEKCSIFLCIVPALVLVAVCGMRRDSMDTAVLGYYTKSVAYVAFMAMFFMIRFLKKHKRKITNVTYKSLMMLFWFVQVFAVIQILYEKILFTALLAIIPTLGIYMFFHVNPFDEVMGCQNTYAMEDLFIKNVKDKMPFYFGMLQIPSLMHKQFATDNFESMKPLIELIRKLESDYINMHIFRHVSGEFYMIYDIKNMDDPEHMIHNISEILIKRLDEIYIDEKIIMIAIEYNDSIRDIDMMMNVTKQAVKKYSDPFGSCKKLLKQDEYRELVEAYYLTEVLEGLRNEQKYDNDNVVCYAQPIYEVNTKTFKTAEALMRLMVDGKMISPTVFVPIAEANNCIHFLTVCMFHKVCNAIKTLMKVSDFEAISINVSVQEFGEPDAADEFLGIIRSHGVPVRKIRIELTESALVADNDMLISNMQKMADAGIQFYLDDFGTGYSSLERLTELPFSVVKFDKSLLYSALKNKKTDRLINGIVPIIKVDNLVALVEGVENDDQYEYSVGTGFEYVQGYKWAKPVPIMELEEYFVRKDVKS